MLKIAITGNIASGKSTVEKFIEELGYKVFDTDKIAHEILENSEDIRNLFGTLDRKEIAKIVFNDNEKLKLLESIIHPKVKAKIEEIFDLDLDIVFISVPQLFETGFNELFDKIIYITADENIRKERLMKRNSLSEEEALKRIKAQSESKKKEFSDFTIENNGNIRELKLFITQIMNSLLH